MTYRETLTWMFNKLPMYQKSGITALNAKLDKTVAFSSYLKNPHSDFKSIHIAGTNGKGSSSHMLASVLQEAGYKVGLYTSPHLKDFRERIRINGKPISEDEVVKFIKEHYSYLNRYKMSFFEMTVGMAFSYFSKEKVDIAIIEVGLGGNFDATNIIKPEVSLITNIGLDHQAILGDTLEEIAFEKAGIIKRGVPVVVSEYQLSIATIFKEKAKTMQTSVCFASTNVNGVYKTDLLGSYQQLNIKGVVATLKKLVGFTITEKHIKVGLQKVVENTGLIGRWQVIGQDPQIVVDTAHNFEGLRLVIDQLKKQHFKKLHIVLGFVKDKNIGKIVSLFPKTATYYFTKPSIERACDIELLQSQAKLNKLSGESYGTVKEAFAEAQSAAALGDFIFVGGSTFVVAEIL